MVEKKALIIGVTGQDGAHLAKHLLDLGYVVYGGFRRETSNKLWRLDHLGITDRLRLVEYEMGDSYSILELLKDLAPTEIYHLAGHSMVADSFKHPSVTIQTNTLGLLNVLEAVRLISPSSRVFFASSSEIFGSNTSNRMLTETSEKIPSNPYAVSKLAAQHLVRLYRETYGLFACSGIMFNHEGPLRARQFVTRKITYNLARLSHSGGQPFTLGDLDASRDWGAAEDYVQAMHMMLSMHKPEDLVIATGILTSVREFLSSAARAAGFQPVFRGTGMDEVCSDSASGLELARVSDKYMRNHPTPALAGDASRLRQLTGWQPRQGIPEVIFTMIAADKARVKQGITNV